MKTACFTSVTQTTIGLLCIDKPHVIVSLYRFYLIINYVLVLSFSFLVYNNGVELITILLKVNFTRHSNKILIIITIIIITTIIIIKRSLWSNETDSQSFHKQKMGWG